MAKEQEVASVKRLAAKGGIASDESVVAKPEIEANEGPMEEHLIEPDESITWEGKYGEAGCPIEMGYDVDLILRICGRKLHVAPDGIDEKPVCLMHSKDPRKNSGSLLEAFWIEFWRVLKVAGKGEAHFERFIFPQINLHGRELQSICYFNHVIFTQDADFGETIFTQNATFSEATFIKKANFGEVTFTKDVFFPKATFIQDSEFYNATFTQCVDFNNATFTQNVNFAIAIFTQYAKFSEATFAKESDFGGTTFSQNADFNSAIFKQDADFGGAVFEHDANFDNATFSQKAKFNGAEFDQNAVFRDTSFMGEAIFMGSTFAQRTIFTGATFIQAAFFDDATFSQNISFWDVTFSQATYFIYTTFLGTASWKRCRFLEKAEFWNTKFVPTVEGTASAIFTVAGFAKPSEISFDDVDLSRAFFHKCDVSEIRFTSSVRWGFRGNNRGLTVFEETIPLNQEDSKLVQVNGERNYTAIAQIYQQLKKNYDSRLDYWTANEFHFGEMEMKRLAGPARGRLFRGGWTRRHRHNIKLLRCTVIWRMQIRQQLMKLRRWWYRNLGFVALYRLASDYGNSYRKPLWWLFVILFLSAALFPLPGVGLMRQGATQAETYATHWNFQESYGENLWAKRDLVGNSVIASLDAATFQRNPEYAPAYPWGRVVAIVETLLTSSLFALFLLAIRRQFRR